MADLHPRHPRWEMGGVRIRLAAAMWDWELQEILTALETPEGVAGLRREIEWTRRDQAALERSRANVRAQCAGKSDTDIRAEVTQQKQAVMIGSAAQMASRAERERIALMMEATGMQWYEEARDPGVGRSRVTGTGG
ncbi:hypothetical protein [Nocardiopsis suaedae]|uniref:PE-PGRS family protein n=1 Tax=Nocardiopsis suaedae TaxID=3018444 RepID=A0ABT4TLV7_9ACTN|nr:hypothetical protein [Nocardiopsis suaedae]MDA2805682.1 hypothetical protein [Nocardiopsis suaedae]